MKKILIVDDEPDFANLVESYLKKEGYEVDIAYDGASALRKMRLNKPNAVILDVMMPEIDGWAVCKKMKADSDLSDVTVIMLTCVADHVMSTKYCHFDGMSTEADDYLSKPATAEDILGSIRSLLGE